MEIFNLLLKTEGLLLNTVTDKGTALHLACRHGKAYVSALLAKNIDPLYFSINFRLKIVKKLRIKNEEGVTAFEICSNDEICKLLTEKISQIKPTEGSPKFGSSQYAPPKTPIVMGWLYKTGPLIFNIKRRFFVLDPYDGTFIRFERREDYPLKPRLIYILLLPSYRIV